MTSPNTVSSEWSANAWSRRTLISPTSPSVAAPMIASTCSSGVRAAATSVLPSSSAASPMRYPSPSRARNHSTRATSRSL